MPLGSPIDLAESKADPEEKKNQIVEETKKPDEPAPKVNDENKPPADA